MLPTGYEFEMYRDIARIATAAEEIVILLTKINKNLYYARGSNVPDAEKDS